MKKESIEKIQKMPVRSLLLAIFDEREYWNDPANKKELTRFALFLHSMCKKNGYTDSLEILKTEIFPSVNFPESKHPRFVSRDDPSFGFHTSRNPTFPDLLTDSTIGGCENC